MPAIGRLAAEDVDAIGREFDAIRADVVARLGRRDADYIRGVISVQRAVRRLLGRRDA